MKYENYYALFGILIIVHMFFLALVLHWYFGALIGLIGLGFMEVADRRDERLELLRNKNEKPKRKK